jgi:uncharacterized protein YfbU (UPF0304 family)
MLFSKESTSVKIDMIAKMPIVTPSSDRTVLRRFVFSAFAEKRKLSKINFMINDTGTLTNYFRNDQHCQDSGSTLVYQAIEIGWQ